MGDSRIYLIQGGIDMKLKTKQRIGLVVIALVAWFAVEVSCKLMYWLIWQAWAIGYAVIG